MATFFSALKSNLKCAFCKEKECPVRYLPDRELKQFYHGTVYVTSCKKDKEKWERDLFKEDAKFLRKYDKKMRSKK